MAKKEAGKKTTTVQKRAGINRDVAAKTLVNLIILTVILTILAAILVSLGMNNVFYLLFLSMLPGFAAHVVDRRPGRFASKTIIAFNLAGLIPHLASILASGNPNTTAQSFITNPDVWLLVYGFAAFGWLTIRIIPQIAFLYLSMKADFNVKKLEHLQQKLIDEWGEGIKPESRKA